LGSGSTGGECKHDRKRATELAGRSSRAHHDDRFAGSRTVPLSVSHIWEGTIAYRVQGKQPASVSDRPGLAADSGV